jgi:hypothetical protein
MLIAFGTRLVIIIELRPSLKKDINMMAPTTLEFQEKSVDPIRTLPIITHREIYSLDLRNFGAMYV